MADREGPGADALDAVTLDDAVPTPDAPAPDSEPLAIQTEAPPPDQPTETPDPAPPGSPGPDAVTADPTPTFVPPSGVPFTLKVDRTQVPIDGAVETPDGGLYLSPDARRIFQHNYVGDRHAWAQERRSLIQQAQAGTQAATAKEERLDAGLAMVAKIFSDPAYAQEQLQNWGVNGPLLQAQAERDAIVRERDRLAQQVQEREQQEEQERLIPQLQRWMASEVEQALATDYKGLFTDEQAVKLVRSLWDRHRAQFFYEGTDNRIHLDQDALRGLLEERADLVRQAQAGVRKVAEVKKVNQAVLTPTKPGPAAPAKPQPPKVTRDEAGKFTTRPDPDEWEKQFRAKKYLTT